MRRPSILLTALCALAALAGCGDRAILRPIQSTGPGPQLPRPFRPVVATVNIASAWGWPEGTGPVTGEGLRVGLFADKLAHPRTLLVLPNGDVLVTETASPGPDRGHAGHTLRGALMYTLTEEAGEHVQSANRIILLFLSFLLSLVVLAVIVGELAQPRSISGWDKCLVTASLVLVWTFGNAVYALHYAHLFYTSDDGGRDCAGGGMDGMRAKGRKRRKGEKAEGWQHDIHNCAPSLGQAGFLPSPCPSALSPFRPSAFTTPARSSPPSGTRTPRRPASGPAPFRAD